MFTVLPMLPVLQYQWPS